MGAIETVPALETARPALKNLGPSFLQSLLLGVLFTTARSPTPPNSPAPLYLALLITSPLELRAFTTPCFFLPNKTGKSLSSQRPAHRLASLPRP